MGESKETKQQPANELDALRAHIEELEQSTSNLEHINNILQQSEALYNSLLEHSLDAIYIHDLQGNFVDANPAALNMLGFEKGDIASINLATLLRPEQLTEVIRQNMELMEKGTYDSKLTEFELQRKDGSYVWVESKASIILKEGKPYSVLGIARDITERKKMLEELETHRDHLEKLVEDRTRELEDANEQLKQEMAERKRAETELVKASKIESLGVFAGGIAHDFNNLMTAVVGNVSVAKRMTESKSKIYQVLSVAEDASFRTKDLTQQLVTFSKGGAPIKQTTHLSDLIQQTVGFALSGANVKCNFSIAKNLWNAKVDAGQVSQVIHNLVINAVQAMPDGGTIRLSAENTTMKKNETLQYRPGDYIKIAIKDSGAGIASESINKIFDPYYTTKKKGSGLGLAISYSIIKKHDGYITVDSKIDTGSTFHIYLPATQKQHFREELKPDLNLKGGERVLVIDDQDLVRVTLVNMLCQMGFDVECAANGSEAVELYNSAKRENKGFNVVIMDLTIPGDVGGKKIIKQLLDLDSKVKAIVSSGYSDDQIMSNYSDYGFVGVLAKPYKYDELTVVLSKILN